MKKSQNKIEKLIKELCPNGVEYGELGDLVDYEQPSKYIVKDSEYSDEYKTPVLTAGQTFILGYTNEDENIFKADEKSPVIIFDDFTTSFHWVDFAFKVKSSAMKILLPKNKEADFRYIYYAMKCINFVPQTHARHWISKYSKFRIPLPPLDIQKEIAKILNEFTELEAELEAELESRKKQYEYYRRELLKASDKTELITLGEIGRVSMCKRIYKNQTSPSGDIPFYKIGTFGQEPNAFISRELYEKYKDKYPYPNKGDILLSASGTIGRRVIYDGEPAYYQDSNIIWFEHDEKVVLNKYLYHLYAEIEWDTEGGTIKRLYNDNLKKVSIPLPTLSEQKRIVSILDKFDSLVNDISIGLPAELKARRKQYEYYRNKLLTFKEYGK